MRIEEKVIQALIRQNKSLAIAESCTGGLVADRLTNVPGCSKALKAALVAYSNEAKIAQLKVPQETLRAKGSVSTAVAIAMAQGARKLLKADFGIGITGIAGPSGGTKAKPVGLTFITVSHGKETLCLECRFEGGRRQVKSQAATQALRLIYEFLA